VNRDAIAAIVRNLYPPQLPYVGPCVQRAIVGKAVLRQLGIAAEIATGAAVFRISRDVAVRFSYHCWLAGSTSVSAIGLRSPLTWDVAELHLAM
jgi:hypothetical protein